MALRIYSLQQLMDAAKAIIRGIPGVGTEPGSDHDVTLNAAARLLQVGQVAGKYVYDQLDPKTSDAVNRDRMVDVLGLQFERDATPARGLMSIFSGNSSAFSVPAGTEITVPGTNFADGVERVYKTLEDAAATGFDGTASQFSVGTNIWKARLVDDEGVKWLARRSLVLVYILGLRQWTNAVRRVNLEDQSVDLYIPIKEQPSLGAADVELQLIANNVVVPVECVTPGYAGNVPHCTALVEIDGVTTPTATIYEMGGGGDEVGPIDGDTDRVVRLVEDTIAMPPSFGNAQHWREIALACPDVDLDDAVVYQHVRGPGTVDIVAIGRSGGIRSTSFPDANIGFCEWGNNTRRIGEVQAEKLEAWCKSRASYFDDIKVHSVEWDYNGMTFGEPGSRTGFRFAGRIDLSVSTFSAYGPDSGVALNIIPSQTHASRIYPASGTIDARIQPGHRVWVAAGNSRSTGAHPFTTVVTEVLSVAADRAYATVADVSALGPAAVSLDEMELHVLRWGTAGPVTQSVIDAVYAYYDGLGPGSYLVPPRGPGYSGTYETSTFLPPTPGMQVLRWPPEGRRWDSGLRASELRARILAIEGVRAVTIATGANQPADFDPVVFKTLALTGVHPAYA